MSCCRLAPSSPASAWGWGLGPPTTFLSRRRSPERPTPHPGSFRGTWADPADLASNWAVDYEIMIFVSGPLAGNSLVGEALLGGNTCGTNANRWGTSGYVSHT